jgi:hypothetical protein
MAEHVRVQGLPIVTANCDFALICYPGAVTGSFLFSGERAACAASWASRVSIGAAAVANGPARGGSFVNFAFDVRIEGRGVVRTVDFVQHSGSA